MEYPESLKLEIAKAICDARQSGHEGPYGLFDYSAYGGKAKPHVVRDFRFGSQNYGGWVFSSDCAIEAQNEYDRLTNIHVADAAIAVMHRYMASGSEI